MRGKVWRRWTDKKMGDWGGAINTVKQRAFHHSITFTTAKNFTKIRIKLQSKLA